MIFVTYWFVLSVALLFPVFWLFKSPKVRIIILLVYSACFHAHFAGAAGVIPIIVLATVTYLAARSGNRAACTTAIVICVLALCHYKYSLFIVDQIANSLAPEAADTFHAMMLSLLPATPPLAISFFTFEFVHYLAEARKHKPIKSVVDFATFTIFFPSLVAGPIKRYQQFIPSLHSGMASVRGTQVMLGLLQVVSGYAKKLLIADNLTPYIEAREVMFGAISIEERWLVLLALNVRIYMDFSGYSDIAIGLARMLGVELPANFNWPYLATNIRDFWRRWHISLSTWIRDYIYFPLVDNSNSKLRKVLCAMVAFGICGLWHGADWHFLAWGLYHGVGVTICLSYRKVPILGKLGIVFDASPISAWMLTMLFVAFSRLLFFYPVQRAWDMFLLLFRL